MMERAEDFRPLLAALGVDRGESFGTALVLGSGFGPVIERFRILAEFPYRNYPCFPVGTVSGHRGMLYVASHAGSKLLLFAGRFHLYQGLSAWQAALPVRIAAACGCRRLLLSCAVGGIRDDLSPGDLVWVDDHLNLQHDTPLRGFGDSGFIDLSRIYANHLFETAARQAAACNVVLKRGVLAAVPGPNYETPAEIRMLKGLGADVVSMSTVPEAIMARYHGIETVALALIANRAAGLADAPLDHADVLASVGTAAAVTGRFVPSLIDSWKLPENS